MAPAIKLIDKTPGEPNRHANVYRTFGKLGITIKKVHDARGAFYVIVSEENLEKILTEENKRECRKEGYEIQAPLEYNSIKTIVVKQLDNMVDSFSDQEIVDSIHELNDWAKVESMYRLPTTSKMLKIRFTSQQMVQTAMTKGLVILHQFIPHWNVEREIFVRLTPCRNCFSYEHKIKDCTVEKKMRCTYCAGEHKQSDCTATEPWCINCGGAHRTLASACRIRKDLIKKRSKEIRERSKSRNRQGGAQSSVGAFSYAEAARTGAPGEGRRQETTNPLTKEETKDMLTIIMSAIVYGHYMEALVPGSFQANVSEVYRLNGLREVKFPPPTMVSTVMEACKEVFRGRSKEGTRKEAEDNRSSTRDSSEQALEMDLDDEVIEQEEREIETMIKRHRDSMTPPLRDDKRKKQEREAEDEIGQRPPLPQRPTVKRAMKPESGATEKTKGGTQVEAGAGEDLEQRKAKTQPRSRSSSTSSQQSQPEANVTKQIGLTVYVRKTSNIE